MSSPVPAEEMPELQEAIDGCNLFRSLAEQYADEIIRATRKEGDKEKTEEEQGGITRVGKIQHSAVLDAFALGQRRTLHESLRCTVV